MVSGGFRDGSRFKSRTVPTKSPYKKQMGVYVYCIREDYRYQSAIKGSEFENEWFILAKDGTVIVKGTHYKGYAWDGCSPKMKIKDVYFGIMEGVLDTFGGVQTPPFRAGKDYAALSINPEQTTVFRPWCRRIDFDTGRSKTYYASLIHDVFYQFSKEILSFVRREDVDREFYTILKRDNFRFAFLYYLAVRLFGWIFWYT